MNELVFIFLLVVLAVAIILAVGGIRALLFPAALAFIGGGSDPICSRTDEYVDTFLHGRLTQESVAGMNNLIADIALDTETVTEKKLRTMKGDTLNATTAKILLDTMTHYYIYDKRPNNLSRRAISANTKKLEALPPSHFHRDTIRSIIKYTKDLFSEKRAEETVSGDLATHFRNSEIACRETTATTSASETVLREELSRKNIELRQTADELTRARLRPVNSLGNEILLEECNRERRHLHERIYELKRDIERLKSQPHNDAEIHLLKSRVDELRARNAQLEEQLRASERRHAEEMTQISSLTNELNNCRAVLDEVLNSR